MFITFEGIDGCGKTTQLRLLAEYLNNRGIEVLSLREPGGLPLSEKIRTILLNSTEDIHPVTELFLFEASRSHLVHNIIKPALDAGKAVLCDRFYDSTTVYQGYGRELNIDMINRFNAVASLGISPDITVYLDLSYEKAAERCHRRNNDRIESSGKAFFEKLVNGFRELAKQIPERIVKIDADGEIDEVQNTIISAVNHKFGL